MRAPLTLSVLLASRALAALPPLSTDYRMAASTHVFTGTLVRIKAVTLLDFKDPSEALWKGTDVDPSQLNAFELSQGRVDRSSGYVWETEAEVEVREHIKGPGPRATHTVRYRNIALPFGMVGPTGQYSSPEVNGVYKFYASADGLLLEPNGFEQALAPRGPLPVALDDDDINAGHEAGFSPPKLKHSSRGGFMGGELLVLTRSVTTDECPWLDADLAEGERVYVYRGHTYGVVGRSGLAVSRAPQDPGEDKAEAEPFFEIPRDAVALLSEE